MVRKISRIPQLYILTGLKSAKEFSGMERRFGMSGIDNLRELMSMKVEDIKSIVVMPVPLLSGLCANHKEYSPAFPLFLNGIFCGIPCGNCITDFLQDMAVTNPSVQVFDKRKVLYN
jgi:hypothetical protein